MSPRPQQYSPKQQMQRSDFELQYKQDLQLHNVELHHHDFYEIYYLISGDVVYTIESKFYRILPGDILLISPRELHQVQIQAERAVYERYVLWISPQMIQSLSSRHSSLVRALDPLSPGYSNQLRPQGADRQHIRSLLEQLSTETQKPSFGSDLMPGCLLTQLLVSINRLALREECRPSLVSYSDSFVAEVIDYINLNYAEKLTLDLLAEKFFISKYHLSHEFQRQLGTSVGRYIQKKRLQIARHLMAQGIRASEVGHMCGFQDYTAFYRAFRSEYGTSPREFLAERQR